MQPDSSLYNQCITLSNSKPVPGTSVLMPHNVQKHRQVPLSDTKISKETEIELHKMLQKYDAIISKSNNNIGQTDLIKMYIATKPNAAPIAPQLYPLALKHHDFLKQGIILSPWASPIVIVKKHILKVHHSSFTCALATCN